MTFYKDFNKDVKDLLTKNFSEEGKWKVETKFKGGKDTLFVNPQGTNAGLSVDVEYNPSCCGAKVKVNVAPKNALKLTASYEDKGHKVEVVTDKDLAYEVSYEGKVAGFALNDKLTGKEVDAGVSYGVAKHCQVGAGVTFGLKDSSLKWSAGARYADAGRLVTLQTFQLQKYLTGVYLPLTVLGKKATVGAQVDCGHNAFAVTAGLEIPCILFPNNNLRVRVTDKLAWAAAYIAKFPNSWKAAISVDSKLNPGITFTQE